MKVHYERKKVGPSGTLCIIVSLVGMQYRSYNFLVFISMLLLRLIVVIFCISLDETCMMVISF